MSRSTLWSVSVTRSTGELFSMTLMSFWSASRITWQRHARSTADCTSGFNGRRHIIKHVKQLRCFVLKLNKINLIQDSVY